MTERGWKSSDVARRMGGKDEYAINLFAFEMALCAGDHLRVDDPVFDDIARAFDVTPEFLRNLHAGWLKNPSKRSPFTPPDDIFSGRFPTQH